jgi:hypothetical protein
VDAVVWMSDWQLQCCGVAFAVGSRVSWNLVEPDLEWLTPVVGHDEATAVAYAEDHHGEEGIERTGWVEAIREVHYQVAAVPDGRSRVLYPVEGSGKFRSVRSADGYPNKIEHFHFGGYLVNLRIPEA